MECPNLTYSSSTILVTMCTLNLIYIVHPVQLELCYVSFRITELQTPTVDLQEWHESSIIRVVLNSSGKEPLFWNIL